MLRFDPRLISPGTLITLLIAGSAAVGIAPAAGAAPSTGPAADRPWLAGPFQAEPKQIAAAAAADLADPTAGVVVLLEHASLSFDEVGRVTRSLHLVYKLQSATAIEEWSVADALWYPSRQHRPELKARVISADGKAYPLDPDTIDESPASDAPALFDDARILHAPLPRLKVGVVVEQLSVVRDREALFATGWSGNYGLGGEVPYRAMKLSVEAPVGLPLQYRVRGTVAASVERSESDGRQRLELVAGPIPPQDRPEPMLPRDVPPGSFVAIATGASWNAMARTYAAVVAERLDVTDVNELAATIAGDRTEPRAVVDRMLAYVQEHVRYTGIEFGERSIVPSLPAETLARNYGDCKDQATLLVALVRARGIAGEVALLRATGGFDVDPELPALGHFNHAIVYLPELQLWIDPTDPSARLGELPWVDQDRRALVAAASTTELLDTPASSSTDNEVIEERRFELAKLGPAWVTETTHARGSVARSYRGAYDDAEDDVIHSRLTEYVKGSFGGNLQTWSRSPADSRDPAFTLTLDIADARRGQTTAAGAVVGLSIDRLFERLPRLPSADDEDMPEGRQHDFILHEPHAVEWRYQVVAPPGLRPLEPPPGRQVELGPARYTESYAVDDDGVLEARFRFDTMVRQLTPDQVEQLASGIATLQADGTRVLRFENTSYAHLQAGRVREALTELRSLAKRFPDEATYPTQIANALLVGGLGEPAREAARAAIRLQPDAAIAHRALGWTLQHDLFGRRFNDGWDRQGAIDSYRAAVRYDPEFKAARGDLAILLETNADGVRYGAGADLAGAIELYEGFGDDLDSVGLGLNLPIALAHAGRAADAEAQLRKLSPGEARDIWLVALAAAQRGLADGLTEAARWAPAADARRELMSQASLRLLALGRFDLAAGLLDEATAGASNATQRRAAADLIRRLHAVTTQPPATGAAGALEAWMRAMVSDQGTFDTVTRLYASDVVLTDDDRDGWRIARRALRGAAIDQGLPGEISYELWRAQSRLVVDGDEETGYRVRVRSLGLDAGGFEAYVRSEGGTDKMVGDTPVGIGREALRLIEVGKLEAARQWLDWARETIAPAGGDDPLLSHPFTRLWTRGEQADPSAMRLAAASLLAANDDTAAAALGVIEDTVLDDTEPSDAPAESLDHCRVLAHASLRQPEPLLAASTRLIAAYPRSATAFTMHGNALNALGRFKDAQAHYERRLAKLPNDPTATRERARSAAFQSRYPEARSFLQKLVDRAEAIASDYNELAWFALLDGNVELHEPALKEAQNAVQLSRGANYAMLHTLATVLAELGQTNEARQTLLRALQLDGAGEPQSADWYVLGLLAEHYGVEDAARTAYAQVEAEEPYLEAISTHFLAQRRLAAMDAAVATATAPAADPER